MNRFTHRGRPWRLVSRALSVVVSAFVFTACPPPPLSDGGVIAPLLTVGDVTFTLAPFAMTLKNADGDVVSETVNGGDGCAPLFVALRPDDDEGAFFAPEDPSPSLVYAMSKNAVVDREDPLTLSVDMGEGETATVRAVVGDEGFVDVNIDFSHNARGVAMVGTCLSRGVDGHAVGGGERFAGVDISRTVVPLQFRAPGPFASGTNEAHAPIPFMATTDGLGLFVESERVGAFDVGNTDAATHRIRLHGTTLPLRFRSGHIVENVAAHARRAGLPPMPPSWVLAPQQWRNEHAVDVDGNGTVTMTGRDRFEDDARMLRLLDIPTTTMWVDAPWQTGYNTFIANDVQFPDFAGMINDAEALGFRVIVWATEHVNSSNDEGQQVGMPAFGSQSMFNDFESNGFLVKTPTGDTFSFPWARGVGGHVDFTNPAARAAYQEKMRPLIEKGVRGFKLDFGETMRPDIVGAVPNDAVAFSDGTTTEVQHTRYTRLYHETFIEELKRVHPDGHMIIARSGGLNDQKNGTVIWPGDLDNDFGRAGTLDDEGKTRVGGLPAAIAGGLSLAMSGYPLYGSDIGGYRGGPPTTEALLRWAQFGALSPVMQLGGGGTGDATHNPWDPRYDPIAVDVYRTYAKLHMSLVPTLESALRRATTTGHPVMVPLGVAFPDVEDAWDDDTAYLFADDLLVAPVVTEGATSRDVWIPAGTFFDWWTGDVVTGPMHVNVDAPLASLPLFLRSGAVVVLYPESLDTLVDSSSADVVDLGDLDHAIEVRTSAGDTSARTLRDETSVSQVSVDGKSTVTVDGGLARDVVIRFLARADFGPSLTAAVSVNGAAAVDVENDAFAACTTPCRTVVGNELRVRARAARVVVEIGP